MKKYIRSNHLRAYQFWRFADHVLGNKAPSNRYSKQREKVKRAIEKDYIDKKHKGVVKQVQRLNSISDKELFNEYIKKGIPVVLEGKAANWACVKKWTPEWLLEKYGDDKLSLMNPKLTTKVDDASSINYEIKEATLRDVLLAMKSNDVSKYARFNRLLYNHPELKKDLDFDWLLSSMHRLSTHSTYQAFIGGKGTKTNLHVGSEYFMFIQVYGTKHWSLYHPSNDAIFDPPINRAPYYLSLYDPDKPDYDKFYNAKYLQTWECELNAGDILFNPPGWWHQVSNRTDSIGISYRWFNLLGFAKLSFMQPLLIFLATNPPVWKAMKIRTDFAKIFSFMKS